MRKKKEPTFAYGIEITKPFSKEMYDHNDMVAKEMRTNIFTKWNLLIDKCIEEDKFFMDRDWDEDEIKDTSKNGYNCPELVKLQRGVCYSGYGEGYTIQDVCDEFKSEVDSMQNWQLHDEYSYLSSTGVVRRTKYMMVGFKWDKHDYANVIMYPEPKV